MSKTIIYNLTTTDGEGRVLHEGSYFDIISIVHELPKIREVAQEKLSEEEQRYGILECQQNLEGMIPEIK